MTVYRLSANVNDFPWLEVRESHLSPPLGFHFRGGDTLSEGWVPPSVAKMIEGGLPDGEISDFPNLSGAPVFSQRATDVLLDLLVENGELLPVRCGEGTYHAYNVTTVVNALDEDRSVLERFPSSGRVMEITEFVFIPERVQGLTIFKIPQDTHEVYVTDPFVTRVREAELTGFVFERVWTASSDVGSGSGTPMSDPASCRDMRGDGPLGAEVVDSDIREEMEESAAAAAEQLGIASYAEPEEVVRAILEFAEETRPLDGEELDDMAVALGCLWGEQVRRALRWEWVELVEDHEFVGYAIVSPDRSLASLPIVHIREILRDPERDNTVLLLFNMFVAGTTPTARPGQLKLLS